MNKKELLDEINDLSVKQYDMEKGELIDKETVMCLVRQIDGPLREMKKVPQEIYDKIQFITVDNIGTKDIVKIDCFWECFEDGEFSAEAESWLNKHGDDVIDAIRYGCKPIKKEYMVRIGNLIFRSWGEDGVTPDFVVDDQPGAEDGARKFSGKEVAEATKKIIGGKVEEI